MDKYKKVEKPKQDVEIRENEIRITTQGKMRNYISYATGLFREKNVSEVVLKAMGRAINKTVTIAEIIKRRIAGLHQITQIESTDIKDVWEPLEVGLDTIETTRHVSSITITLSSNPLDTTSAGYQPPIPADQVRPVDTFVTGNRGPREIRADRPPAQRFHGNGRGGRGRGRSRGRGSYFRDRPQPDGTTPVDNSKLPAFIDPGFDGAGYGGGGGGGGGGVRGGYRGRGRGRGRGGRGRNNFRGRGNSRGRIYYNNPQWNNNNNGGYNNNNNNNNNNNGNNNNNNNFGGENLGRPPRRGRGRGRGGRGRRGGINVNPQQQPQIAVQEQ